MELGSIRDAIYDAVSHATTALSFLPQAAVTGLVLALAVIASLAVHWLLRRAVWRAFAGRPFVLSLLERVRALTRLTFVTLALALVLPAVSLPPDIAAWTAAALRLVIIVLIGWIALAAVDIGVTVYLLRFQLDTPDNLLARKHVTQMRVLQRVISTLVVVITAAAALMTFSEVRQVGVSLFASAGVAGIVAGLAARPVLANLIAGIQLAITQPIRLEDAVIVENEWGTIEEITSTYVVVRLWDLRRMVVPLSYFIEKPFQNWTHEGSALIGSVLLYLDYTAPIERIRAKAAEIAAQSKLWDRQVVGTQVTDARERTIEVRVLASAANASAAFDLRCEMREKLIAFLHTEFPSALPHTRAELTLDEATAAGVANRGALESGPALPTRVAAGGR
jgi:small-conductance mechanosensitive channel